MANINEIAQMAGVSVTTVSRVLNNHPYVSKQKREAVEQVIKRLNYTRNSNAINLATGKTNIIGVVLPYVNHPYFDGLLEGITKKALEYNYRILLCQTNYDQEEEKKILKMVRKKQLDGIIVCSKALPWEEIKKHISFAEIVACEDAKEYGISSVYTDHYEAFLLALQHLIKNGHRHIGYTISRGDSNNAKRRYAAYCDALARIGEPVNKEWIFTGCYIMEDGIKVARELVGTNNGPTALISTGDEVAAGIITEARKHGIKVPEDLAVIGFDNLPISRVLDITTIEQSTIEIGANAFEMLYKNITQEQYQLEQLEMPFQLINRSTV